jgi:hypothetical protein
MLGSLTQTAEPLVTESTFTEAQTAIEKLESCYSPDADQIMTELIQYRGNR